MEKKEIKVYMAGGLSSETKFTSDVGNFSLRSKRNLT